MSKGRPKPNSQAQPQTSRTKGSAIRSADATAPRAGVALVRAVAVGGGVLSHAWRLWMRRRAAAHALESLDRRTLSRLGLCPVRIVAEAELRATRFLFRPL